MSMGISELNGCHVTSVQVQVPDLSRIPLFRCTFCRQRRSIVSTEEFEADKDSLRRMLIEFQHDNSKVSLHPFCHS